MYSMTIHFYAFSERPTACWLLKQKIISFLHVDLSYNNDTECIVIDLYSKIL